MSIQYLIISGKFPDTPIPFSSLEEAEEAKREMKEKYPEYTVSIKVAHVSHPDPYENGSSHIPTHPTYMSKFGDGPVISPHPMITPKRNQ